MRDETHSSILSNEWRSAGRVIGVSDDDDDDDDDDDFFELFDILDVFLFTIFYLAPFLLRPVKNVGLVLVLGLAHCLHEEEDRVRRYS